MTDLGKYIKARLKELGMTQGDLAVEVGVSDAAISKWIKKGTVSRDNAIKASAALGVSVDSLLGLSVMTIENELERQVLLFFRGSSESHKHDILQFANNLYSLDSPADPMALGGNPKKSTIEKADQ